MESVDGLAERFVMAYRCADSNYVGRFLPSVSRIGMSG